MPVDKHLPMQAHIVGRDDGSGYYQLSNLWSQICDLNAAYSTTGIQFYLKFPLSYVDDTDMYEHTDYSGAYSTINSSVVTPSVFPCRYCYENIVKPPGASLSGNFTSFGLSCGDVRRRFHDAKSRIDVGQRYGVARGRRAG